MWQVNWQRIAGPLARRKKQDAKYWLRKFSTAQNEEERQQIFHELLDLLDQPAGSQPQNRAQANHTTRDALLAAIARYPDLLSTPAAITLITKQIDKDEYGQISWQQVSDLVDLYTELYSYTSEDQDLQADIRNRAGRLLHASLRQYERERKYERLIEVLRMIPSAPGPENMELRHVAALYELRRVRRSRLWLYRYLALQAVLVILVFPLLFMNSENGEIQRRIEETAGVELGDEGYRLFSYTSALYWSIITATSIGYGDIAPLTTTGRMISAVLGTMGVVTIGIVTGLILRWITPREL